MKKADGLRMRTILHSVQSHFFTRLGDLEFPIVPAIGRKQKPDMLACPPASSAKKLKA
jgi:hypothetical protein